MLSPSDYLEAAALMDVHEAGRELADQLQLRTAHYDDAFVSVAANLPASAIVLNRAIFPGHWLDNRQRMTQLVSHYRTAGVSRYFLQPSGPGQLAADLSTGLSLTPARAWQKFRRQPPPPGDQPSDLTVRQIGPDDGHAFGCIVADAFDLGAAGAALLARLPGRQNWHVFMSFAGDEPAGTGALFVKDGKAWTDWGATAPAYRRRGGQAAVLAARIHHAIELGCQEIWTCTGAAVPGDPQHSYRNIVKLGFQEADLRLNFAPAQ